MSESWVNISERIIHMLMLKSYFLDDVGLMEGKMGVILAMLEYSKVNKEPVIADFSFELLDHLMTNIPRGLSFSFDKGLSGIGWGIEYLLNNQLAEGVGVEICEEIDREIMQMNPLYIIDTSLKNGIEGLLHYIIFHTQNAQKQKCDLPFDNRYYENMYETCKRLKKETHSKNLECLLNTYCLFFEKGKVENYSLQLLDFAFVPANLPEKIVSYPLGLTNGLAGILLHLMGENKKYE
ncbi:hypothetical protein [Bacteroides sp. 519]|uniref:hypothetical protein n=1 Tax=Bacteroides sp. 519 TaxID=2302937 RepID=UPI00194030A2|nr:hypothetical protein [Bacteroides sp. 519]